MGQKPEVLRWSSLAAAARDSKCSNLTLALAALRGEVRYSGTPGPAHRGRRGRRRANRLDLTQTRKRSKLAATGAVGA